MTATSSGSLLRYAPVAAFGIGVVLCFGFWLGIVMLVTGAYRSSGTISVAQARDALFSTARDMTEGRSAIRAAH